MNARGQQAKYVQEVTKKNECSECEGIFALCIRNNFDTLWVDMQLESLGICRSHACQSSVDSRDLVLGSSSTNFN